MSGDTIHGVVPEHLAGARIDAALSELTPLSRSRAAALIKAGNVKIGGVIAKRASSKVAAGADLLIVVPEAEPDIALPEHIPLEVLYEDADVIVINKPKGLVVHPAPGHRTGTLVNALLYHCDDLSGIGGTLRPGIVHRIDKDTTGLMVATKNDDAHVFLQAQFKAHSIERRYDALCVRVGGPGIDDEMTFRTRHGRHPTDRKRFTGKAGPREAATHVRVVERFDLGALYLRCTLETGRTHQIRMHLSEGGAPILGDVLYGGRALSKSPLINRQALHAATLGFDLPDMADAMARLRKGAMWRS
jgi:23S rRNA pseudouridine1911/1915/1917 synthase